MTQDDIDVFNASMSYIVHLESNLQDLVKRISQALDKSQKGGLGLRALMAKADLTEEQKETIKDHIRTLKELEPIVKTSFKKIGDLRSENPGGAPNIARNYDMQLLLGRHTDFFKSAELLKDKGPEFRISLLVGGKNFFYRGPLQNVAMTVIDNQLKDAIDNYQNMLIAYRKYKPY